MLTGQLGVELPRRRCCCRCCLGSGETPNPPPPQGLCHDQQMMLTMHEQHMCKPDDVAHSKPHFELLGCLSGVATFIYDGLDQRTQLDED